MINQNLRTSSVWPGNAQSTVIVALVIGCFSWPDIRDHHWTARAFWYSCISLDVIAIGLATQQTTILESIDHDMDQTGTLVETLGAMLVVGDQPNQEPNWMMIGVWQAPLMLLNYSIILFFVALTIHVCDAFVQERGWGDASKVCAFSWNTSSTDNTVIDCFCVPYCSRFWFGGIDIVYVLQKKALHLTKKIILDYYSKLRNQLQVRYSTKLKEKHSVIRKATPDN